MAPELDALLKAARNNRGLKLVALVLAVITWFTVREITSFTTVVQDVRLDVLLDDGWAVLDRSVDEVDILFRGSQSDIRYLSRDQTRVEVDLRGKSVAGSREVPLGPRNVKVPGGVRAVSVDPSDITLTLDREGERMVAVRANIIGNTPEGYEVEKVVCTPDTIRLQGPQGRLAGIQEVSSVPIDLEGRLQSFALTRTIQPPSETWSARMDPDRVRIDVTLVERSTRKEITDIPVQLLVSPNTPPIQMQAGTRVKLTLKGRLAVLNAMAASNLTAFVDCTVLQPGMSNDLPVHVPIPVGAEIITLEPAQVRVEMAPPS
jgi:YbbR domain-containing protein